MAYNYYQQNRSGGTNHQFQFGAPPAPTFQPQPSWRGMDYYRAHAASEDPSLFQNAYDSITSNNAARGVGINEAQHWHTSAYGKGELGELDPSEIGHAAAYEAYRSWMHNSSMRDPLGGDFERQRDALIGLAVGEAARLLQFTNHPVDHYTRRGASEAAAATASHIFFSSRDEDNEEYPRGRSQHRASFSSSEYDDPYLGDEADYPRHRHHSRHRSSSRPPMAYSAGIASSHSSGMHHHVPSVIPGGTFESGRAGSYSGSYGGHAGSFNGGQYSAGSNMPGMPYSAQMPMYGQMGAPLMGVSPTYGQGPMGISPTYSVPHQRHRSSSFSMPYGQPPGTGGYGQPQPFGAYSGQQQYMPMVSPVVPQSQAMMIMAKPHKKHHKHHHKSKRSRSVEYPGSY
ncbi:hypothetical protein C8J56DRAFT_927495 [Mycena floridula]|nr:hypothetical protein C8J56DRAFT_927495 [Mycena floridula]